MPSNLLLYIVAATSDQLLRNHLAWLPPGQQEALRATLRDAVLAGLQTYIDHYRLANGSPHLSNTSFTRRTHP
jgi:hypothetical protein